MPHPPSAPRLAALRRIAGGISRAVTRFEEIVLAGGILGIAALTIGNVLLRALFGRSLYFATEVSQFLIVGVTFLGLGYATAKGRHVRMTALYDQLPRRWQKVVMVWISGTTSALLFYLTYLGLQYALGTVRELGSLSPVLQVPLWLVYLAAPLGFALAGVQYLLALIKNLVSPEVYLSFQRKDEYDEGPPAAV